MGMRHAQRGISIVGILMLAGLVGFIALMGLKIGPLYMEWGKVSSTLDGLVPELATKRATKRQISDMLKRRFDVNDVERVNLKEHLTIKRVKGGKMKITIAYEARAPLFSNLSVVAAFEKSVEAGPGS